MRGHDSRESASMGGSKTEFRNSERNLGFPAYHKKVRFRFPKFESGSVLCSMSSITPSQESGHPLGVRRLMSLRPNCHESILYGLRTEHHCRSSRPPEFNASLYV